MADGFDIGARLNEVRARMDGLRPGILPKTGPVRQFLGVGGKDASATSTYQPASQVQPIRSIAGVAFENPGSGFRVLQGGYREGVVARPATIAGYRLTS